MIGSSINSFPNTQYQCCECGKIQGLKVKNNLL